MVKKRTSGINTKKGLKRSLSMEFTRALLFICHYNSSHHESPFINGHTNFKHIHMAVKKHKESHLQFHITVTLKFKIIIKPHLNNVFNSFKGQQKCIKLNWIKVQETIYVIKQILDVIFVMILNMCIWSSCNIYIRYIIINNYWKTFCT